MTVSLARIGACAAAMAVAVLAVPLAARAGPAPWPRPLSLGVPRLAFVAARAEPVEDFRPDPPPWPGVEPRRSAAQPPDDPLDARRWGAALQVPAAFLGVIGGYAPTFPVLLMYMQVAVNRDPTDRPGVERELVGAALTMALLFPPLGSAGMVYLVGTVVGRYESSAWATIAAAYVAHLAGWAVIYFAPSPGAAVLAVAPVALAPIIAFHAFAEPVIPAGPQRRSPASAEDRAPPPQAYAFPATGFR